MNRTRIIVPAALVLLVAPGLRAEPQAVRVELRAGRHDRTATPIAMPLPKALAGAQFVALLREDTGRSVPAEVVPGPAPQVVWLVRGTLPAGKSRTYRLTKRIPLPKIVKPHVAVHDDRKTLTVRVDGRRVLVYNQAVVPSPDPKSPYYRRSGHIHPLLTPGGVTVTADFAPDHPHQHGVMFPWTRTRFRGQKTEFWNQKLRLGTVEHVRTPATGSGQVLGHFTVVLGHVALKVTGGPTTVLNETWHVRVYRRTDGFLLDLVSTQTCATREPLEILKYHYGGMAIRCRADWIDTGNFLTSAGRTRKDGNHTRARWCDIHGPVGKTSAGATLMCHPANFRFPQPVRLHPSKPYFCFAPMVLGPFKIAPDKPYVSRYRFFVHDGKPDAKRIEALWHDYADPPEAKLLPPRRPVHL